MKQTAVEFLHEALSIHFTHEQEMQFIGLFNQALEMEKKQRGYTTEDVLKAGEMGEIKHYDYKHIVSLLEEAKALNWEIKKE
jgi:hypothetical protein